MKNILCLIGLHKREKTDEIVQKGEWFSYGLATEAQYYDVGPLGGYRICVTTKFRCLRCQKINREKENYIEEENDEGKVEWIPFNH